MHWRLAYPIACTTIQAMITACTAVIMACTVLQAVLTVWTVTTLVPNLVVAGWADRIHSWCSKYWQRAVTQAESVKVELAAARLQYQWCSDGVVTRQSWEWQGISECRQKFTVDAQSIDEELWHKPKVWKSSWPLPDCSINDALMELLLPVVAYRSTVTWQDLLFRQFWHHIQLGRQQSKKAVSERSQAGLLC